MKPKLFSHLLMTICFMYYSFLTLNRPGFVGLAILVVWTPLFFLTPDRVGISQVVQKNKITNNRGWKEETDKHGFRTAIAGK